MPSQVQPSESHTIGSSLVEQLDKVSGRCTRCQRCVAECQYLKTYGDPKVIADAYDPNDRFYRGLPFECSLCGLCKAVCPESVDPTRLFLEMRRETVDLGEGEFSEHRRLRAYERKGTSKRFSWYGLPEGCDTIFFPGCALSGSREDKTRQVFEHIQKTIPNVGIVLDCCNKPSHDLGQEDYFHAMFGELRTYLRENGVKNILVGCPNCLQVFSEYAQEFETRTIYEFLNDTDLPETGHGSGVVTVHDACVSRMDSSVHDSVRELLDRKGLQVKEVRHARKTALCCGEGGAVGCMSPELAKEWTKKRLREAEGKRMVTYCAGCSHILGEHGEASHLLDLIFEPQAAMEGKVKAAKAPLTYFNRLKLKRYFRSNLTTATSRERDFTFGENATGRQGGKLAILAMVVIAIMTVRATGVMEYLAQDKLQELIEGYGMLAPLIYMAIFAIAPVLFLPGLPISIVGGILFGPVWGVIYTISSATIGACVAFLVSRYLARDWIERKLKSPRWRHLDKQVEKHGWKMVAFTRLIPLFPFNLLNYAFGLTRIRFSHYALGTFLFMLPGCIAFITFSSSLLDLMRGEISSTFLVGLLLMVLVSMLPMFYQRYRSQHDSFSKSGAKEPADTFRGTLRIKMAVTVVIALAVGAGIFLANHFFQA